MHRRQFLQLAAGTVAALVVAEAIPAFDALPTFTAMPSGVGVSGRDAYVLSMHVTSASQILEPFSVWITDGVQRLCLVAGCVIPPVTYQCDSPIVIPSTHRLVVDGNVNACFMLAWSEPATFPIQTLHLQFAEL